MFKPLNKSMEVPVIDFRGQQLVTSAIRDENVVSLPVNRIFHNAPWMALFPNEPMVIIDWKTGLEDIKKFVRKHPQGVNGVKGKVLEKKMRAEMFSKPIEYKGQSFFGCFYWGSAVKQGQTIGVTHDILAEIGFVHEAEDCTRVSRAMFPNGMYGGAVMENPRILFLKPGRVLNGYRVDDGCGLMAEEDAESVKREGVSEIEYNPTAQSMYVWQRFPWREIQGEAEPLIMERLNRLDSVGLEVEYFDDALSKYKLALVEAELLMRFHPYVAGSVRKSAKPIIVQLGTTIPLLTKTFYAVPTLCKNDFVYPEGVEGDFGIVQTYPADDNSSTRAIRKNEHGDPEWEAESRRLAHQEAIQYTLTGMLWTAKGSMQLIPKKLMDGYDFVLCTKDVKLHPGLGDIRSGKAVELEMGETIFAITQWVGPGQCCGCPNDDNGKGIWESMGRDFDGDIMALMLIDGRSMSIWKCAKKWRGLTTTYKIEKTHNTLSWRIEMILNSMMNLVGFATNNQALTYACAPEERVGLAKSMEFNSERSMDVAFNRDIKDGTDCHKSLVDADEIQTRMAQRQSIMLRHFRRAAPWTNWMNNDFIPSMLPELERDLPGHIRVRAANDGEFRRSPEWKMHIQQECEGATIAQIWKFVLPWLKQQYSDSIRAGIIPKEAVPQFMEKGIKTMMLTDYVDWAPSVDERDMDSGYAMYQKFCVLASQVNMSDDLAVLSFKESWMALCNEWAKQYSSVDYAAWVIWRCAHHSRSSRAGAAAVFIGFPEQALKIVREKPGNMSMGSQIRTVIVGLNNNFEYIPDMIPVEGSIRVVVKNGFYNNQLRKMVLSIEPLDGQKVHSDGLPDNLIGMVSELRKNREKEGYVSPPEGEYLARIVRMANLAWACYLSKIS